MTLACHLSRATEESPALSGAAGEGGWFLCGMSQIASRTEPNHRLGYKLSQNFFVA
jgi:hypothetical protein